MADTKISWTDKVWNPVTGCSKISEGCRNCYAKAVHDMRHKAYQEGKKMPKQYAVPFEKVLCHEDRLEIPLKCKKPKKWFVNSMSDLFHPDVPFEFIDKVFKVMRAAKQHTFQLLTKRPEIMLGYFAFQDSQFKMDPLTNLWLGVTAENQEQADKRIPILLQIPAAVRFVSVGPMLGPIKLRHFLSYDGTNDDTHCEWCGGFKLHRHDCYEAGSGIHLVICENESGPNARWNHPDNVRALRDECYYHEVAFHFKQWGEWMPSDVWDPRLSPDKQVAIFPNNELATPDDVPYEVGAQIMLKVGTKKAGCLLDGKEYKLFPEFK